MKKIFSAMLAFLILVGVAVPTSAVESELITVSSKTYMLENGCYCIITIEETSTNSRAALYQKSGNKTYSYYDGADALLWTFTVNGEFAVNQGISAKCIGTSYTYSIKKGSWSLSSATTYGSSNKAYGNATFIKSTLGTSYTKTCSVTLTCDAYGNLS